MPGAISHITACTGWPSAIVAGSLVVSFLPALAGGKVAKEYSGTMPVVGVANRANFVIGQDGKKFSVVALVQNKGIYTAIPVAAGKASHIN